MSIQGLGQSFAAYQPTNMRGMQGTDNGFDPSSVESIMEKDDANVDGVLTIDETPMSEDMFSNADTDSDGELTTDELEEMISNGPPMMSSGMGGGMGAAMAGPPPPMNGGGMEEETTDESSSISTEESSLTSQIFSALDTNQDGQISQEELAAGMAENQSEGGSLQASSSQQTMPQQLAVNAYRQVMESLMTNYTQGDYASSNLSQFLEIMA